MNDLLKSAIADAKAIKDTAMQNAKATLEESIFYKVSPLLESNHENDEEKEKEKDMKEGGNPFKDGKFGGDNKKPNMEAKGDDEEEEEDDTNEAYGNEEEDGKEQENESASLEEILAELEEELKSSNIGSGDNKMDNYDSDTEDPQGPKYFTRKEVMGALESMFSEAIGDEDEDEEMKESYDEKHEKDKKDEMKRMQNELKEAYEVVNQLKGMLQEVNLLNSKLLYTSKLFRNYALSENQKKDILENFERVVTIREAKLLYSTYAKVHEGVDANKGKKSKNLTESFASKPTNSTAPSAATKSNIVNESNNLRARLQELAGIIK
jgi:hypothetical protein